MVKEVGDVRILFELLGGRYYLEGRVSTSSVSEDAFYAVDTYTDDPVIVIFVNRPLVCGYRLLDEQFKRDYDLSSCLRHMSVASLIDIGETAERAFLIYARPKGKSLYEIQNSRKPLASGKLASVIRQIAAVLDYAHGFGLTHGNIHAANIFVANDGSAKLIGFGAAGAKMIASDRVQKQTPRGDFAALMTLTRDLLPGVSVRATTPGRSGAPIALSAADISAHLVAAAPTPTERGGAYVGKLRTVAAAMLGLCLIALSAFTAVSVGGLTSASPVDLAAFVGSIAAR